MTTRFDWKESWTMNEQWKCVLGNPARSTVPHYITAPFLSFSQSRKLLKRAAGSRNQPY